LHHGQEFDADGCLALVFVADQGVDVEVRVAPAVGSELLNDLLAELSCSVSTCANMDDGGFDNGIDILEDVGELATSINIVESCVLLKVR
jgi:hypothetical protein